MVYFQNAVKVSYPPSSGGVTESAALKAHLLDAINVPCCCG